MNSVKKMIKTLNQDHLNSVRSILENDEGYNKYTLVIFDAYLSNASEDEVMQSLGLSEKSFKVFERSIENSIFEFYGLEGKKIQDLIFSSIFYSQYGSSSKSVQDQCAELEELFHNMKQLQIEQASAPLLKFLTNLAVNTPLEPVYAHLYEKYNQIDLQIENMLTLFSQLNQNIEDLLAEFNFKIASNHSLKLLDQIQNIANEVDNHSSHVIIALSKLNIAVFGNSSILDDEFNLDDTIAFVESTIDKLPFGLDRFYLNNVFTHIYCHHLVNEGKLEIAADIISNESERHLFEASNFDFPNHISAYLKDIKSKTKLILNQYQRKNTSVSGNHDLLSGDLFSNILN